MRHHGESTHVTTNPTAVRSMSDQCICQGRSLQSYKVDIIGWGTNNKGWRAVHQGTTPVFKEKCS